MIAVIEFIGEMGKVACCTQRARAGGIGDLPVCAAEERRNVMKPCAI